MNWVRTTLAAALCCLAMPAAAQTTEAGLKPRFEAIDRQFEAFQHDTPTPGLVYGIVAEGKLVHVRGFGVQDLPAKRPVTADTLFRIASMTKAFTALSILSLRDAGKLSLDDFAEKYVPEMRGWKYPTADSPHIRIRDLLSHVAGFVTDDPWGDRQTPMPEAEFAKLLRAGVPFSRVPETAHEYSNFGYALLGRIVANASGMPYRTYVERTILKPLGMGSSGFEVSEWPIERRAIGYRFEDGAWREEPTMRNGAFGPMGGLQVSANDYGKWIAFLLSAWPPRDGPDAGPVKRATVRELAQGLNFMRVTPRMGTAAKDDCMQAAAYGKGLRVSQDCQLGLMLHHGGGYPGYGSHMLLLPEAGVGIFVFTNRTYTGAAGTAWDAMFALDKAGVLQFAEPPATPEQVAAQETARAIYAAGDVSVAGSALAMNFLMDRSAEGWRSDLAGLRAQLGACAGKTEPLFPNGALSVAFRWHCDKGLLDGTVLLAPTRPATIQALRFRPKPAAKP
ncbi:beta-lactamase family protein [Sphingomonas sp. CBMAI 2297]|uniref:serine hydrolase domain-containing protein n=1 Tax=Sphingomonas sp. CBMAI 2297 TaxID=2991720 RepID=UPI0024554EB8|nr:serine hydrolase domain-containing protein [Sphingomonas sp. CBMAI 2297]MDH4743371.1 beta-lactamase family protein [Sphingomonas sp. CBMAI 2297]